MATRTTDPQLAIVGDLPDSQYDAMVNIYAKMVIYHLHHTQDEIVHSAQWQQWQTQLAAIHPDLTYSLIDRFRRTYAPDTQKPANPNPKTNNQHSPRTYTPSSQKPQQSKTPQTKNQQSDKSRQIQ